MKNFQPKDKLLRHIHNRAPRVACLIAMIMALMFAAASGALAKGDKDSDSGKKSSSHEEQSKKKTDDKKDRDDDGKHCKKEHCDNDHHNHPKPPKPPKPPKDRDKTPATPTGLTAQSVSLFQVNLTWTDNSTNEHGFKIERSLDGKTFTQIAQVLPNTTTYRDLNRFPDTKYFYRVCAFNARGNSAYSAVARAQTPAPECELSTKGWQNWFIPIVPDEPKTAVALAAGNYHGVALHADGLVTSWIIEPGIVVDMPPPNLSNVVAIAAAGSHSLALLNNGTVVGWGSSYYGAEFPPAGLTGVVAIATSENHSLALKYDGTVVGWGCEIFGATVGPTNLAGVVAIAAGSAHSLALKSDGSVVGWGSNGGGHAEPPPGLTNAIGIAAGPYHSIALQSDQLVVSWGGFWTPVTSPTNLTNVVAVAASSDSSFALTRDGAVIQWGWVQFGWGVQFNTHYYLIDAKSIVAGGHQFLALTPRPNSPPAVGLKVVATNKVAINWRDTSFGRNSFLVERSSVTGDYDYGNWLTLANLGQGATNYLDTTVTNNSRYRYRVGAYNDCHAPFSSESEIVSVTPPTNTPYLQGNAFADQARLTGYFNNIGVTAYRIERAPDVSGVPGNWSQILTNDISDYRSTYQNQSFDFADGGLPVNTTNWYRLQVFNGLGTSPFSEPIAVAIIPPRQPLYPYARIMESNQVQITWYGQYPNDHSGFVIERTTNAPGTETTWAVIKTDTNAASNGRFLDGDVKVDLNYRYRILAFNVLGYSIPSIETEIKIIPPTAPILTGTPFANNIRLEWNIGGYQGRIERFKIERAKSEAGIIGPWSEITSVENSLDYYWLQYEDRGLSPNSTYLYRIRALNWVGVSPYSAPITVTIVRPVAPHITDISIGSTNSLDIRWQANTPLDQDGFRIERAADVAGAAGSWTEIGSLRTTNFWSAGFTDSNVVANLTYWYRVRAFNGAGLSDYSQPIKYTVAPPANTYLSAYQDADRARVNAHSTEAGVLGFKIERAPDVNGTAGAWFQIANVPTITYASVSITDSNLTPLATYWYRARAYNWIGDSLYSSPAKIRILPPAAPQYFSALIGKSNRVDLAWLANAPWTNSRVERALNVGGIPGAWTELQGLTFTNNSSGWYIDLLTHTSDKAVETDKSYSYRVRVFDVVGFSDYTAPLRVDVIPPPAPFSLTASTFADTVKLRWGSDFNNYGHVDAFEVERAIESVGNPLAWTKIATVAAAQDSTSDSGLRGDKIYRYRVRATNWVGASDYSSAVRVIVVSPNAPYAFSGSVGTNRTVNLVWFAGTFPPDQNGFYVERTSDINATPAIWTEIDRSTSGLISQISYADTNVAAFTTNWYRARAFNNVGVSTNSLPFEMRIIPPPAPSNLEAKAFSNRAKLTWYAFYGDYGTVAGFKIDRAPDVNGEPGAWTQIGTNRYSSSYCDFTDTNLPVNTAWWYRVRAYNWVGDSPYGNSMKTTILPPAAPGYFYVGLGTTNRAELSWIAGEPRDQDGIIVERAKDSGGVPGTWSHIGTVLATNAYHGNYTDTNVVAHSTNWYRLRAFNAAGVSPYSSAVSVNIVPPEKPSNLVAEPDVDRVQLSWLTPFSSSFVGFNIERADDNAGSPGAWSRINSEMSPISRYTDTGRAAGAKYWYRVQSFNWVGASSFSDAVSVTIVGPLAPVGLSATIEFTNTLLLRWSFPYPNRLTADGYKVERAYDNGGIPGTWEQIATNASPGEYYGYFYDTNLTANTTNWYRVRSFNIVGISEPSAPLKVRIIPPSPPQFFGANPFADKVRLGWYGNYNSYGFVQGYEVERADDITGSPGIWKVIANVRDYATEYTDSGRTANSTYWYRVRAYNWIGAGEFSAPVSATIVPPNPPYFWRQIIGTTNSVELNWESGSPYDHSGYLLERASDAGGTPGSWAQITVISNTYGFYADTNVTAFTTNWYRVRSYNAAGVSAYSQLARVAIIPPSAPGYSYVRPFANQLNLYWSETSYNYGEVAGYKIERAPDVSGSPGIWNQIATKSLAYHTDHADTNLPANSTFWYRVRAYNWIGDGPFSTPVSGTINPPARPTNLTASLGTTNSISLFWYGGNPLDQDYFKIECASDSNGVAGAWLEIATVPATNLSYTSYQHTNVSSYVTNHYRVRAFNIVGSSDYSLSASVSTMPPLAPTFQNVFVNGKTVSLHWLPNRTYGIHGFKIQRAKIIGGNPGAWVQIADLPGYYGVFYDESLASNGTYWYRVSAYNWIGDSPFAPALSATISSYPALTTLTIVPPIENIPQITSLILTSNNARVTWSTVGNTTNVVEAASSIHGAFSEVSPWIVIGGSASVTTNYLDVGALTNSSSRFYRIRVVP